MPDDKKKLRTQYPNPFAEAMRRRYPVTTTPADVTLAMKVQGLKEQAARKRLEEAENYRPPAVIRMPKQPSANWVEQNEYLQQEAAYRRGINKPLNQMNALEFGEAFLQNPVVEYPLLMDMAAGGIVKAIDAIKGSRVVEKLSKLERLANANRAARGGAEMRTPQAAVDALSEAKTVSLPPGVPPPTAEQTLTAIEYEMRSARAAARRAVGEQIQREATAPNSPLAAQTSALWTPEQQAAQLRASGYDTNTLNLGDKLDLISARTYVGREVASNTPFSLDELRAVLGESGSRIVAEARMTDVPQSYATYGVRTSSIPIQRVAGFLRTYGEALGVHPDYIREVNQAARAFRWRPRAGGGYDTINWDAHNRALRELAGSYRSTINVNDPNEMARRIRQVSDIIQRRVEKPVIPGINQRSYSARGNPLLQIDSPHIFQNPDQTATIVNQAGISRMGGQRGLAGFEHPGLRTATVNAYEVNAQRTLPPEVWSIANEYMGNMLGNAPFEWRLQPSQGGAQVLFRGRIPTTGVEIPDFRHTGGLQFHKVTGGWTPRAGGRLLPAEEIGPVADRTEGLMMSASGPINMSQFSGINVPADYFPGDPDRFLKMWSFKQANLSPENYPSKFNLMYGGINEALKQTVGGRLHSGFTSLSKGSFTGWSKAAQEGRAWEAYLGYRQPAQRGAAANTFPTEYRRANSLFGLYATGAGTGLGLLGLSAANTPPIVEER